jgi:hypothetical protein
MSRPNATVANSPNSFLTLVFSLVRVLCRYKDHAEYLTEHSIQWNLAFLGHGSTGVLSLYAYISVNNWVDIARVMQY